MAYFGKYQTPAELLNDDNLTRGEKIEMLESWASDKEAYMRASDEGMIGDDRAYLLKEVEKALILLREESRG